ADRHLRRCNRNDEEDHHLAVELVVEAGERDQRKVRRVEHQLERHVNYEQIAPHDDAQQAKAEQQGADGQIMLKTNVHIFGPRNTRNSATRWFPLTFFAYLAGFISNPSCSKESHPPSPPAGAPTKSQTGGGNR